MTSHHVNYYGTEFTTFCGRLLLIVSKFVDNYGSQNFNILYALCMSQFNDDFTDFRDSARKEIIMDINLKFDCLIKRGKKDAWYIKKKFYKLIKKK